MAVNKCFVAHHFDDAISCTHHCSNHAHSIPDDHERKVQRLHVEEEGCDLANCRFSILVLDPGYVQNGNLCTKKQVLLQHLVKSRVECLLSAGFQYDRVAFLELLDLFVFVVEGLDSANVGEGLFGNVIHLALGSLDCLLHNAHPPLVEDGEEAQWDDATEADSGQFQA